MTQNVAVKFFNLGIVVHISQITPRDIRLDQKDIDTHKLYCM